MTGASRARLRARVQPAPTPEEGAAIVAALEVLRGGQEAAPGRAAGRSRWRLTGLLGHPPPREAEDPLWSYARWEDVP